jgi:hypothetical protein
LKRVITLMLVVAALGACAYKAEPIYNVDHKPLPSGAQSLPPERIEALIIEGGHVYSWQFERRGAGHLVAAQRQPKYSAVVDIYFDQKTYSIIHQSSEGLLDTGTTIHGHYNLWIRNLEKGIDTRLADARLE